MKNPLIFAEDLINAGIVPLGKFSEGLQSWGSSLTRILHGKSVDRVADMSQPASRSRHDEPSRVLGTALMYDSFLTMGAGKERQKQKNGAKGTTADVRMVPDVAGGPAPRAATTATARPDPPGESTDEHAG